MINSTSTLIALQPEPRFTSEGLAVRLAFSHLENGGRKGLYSATALSFHLGLAASSLTERCASAGGKQSAELQDSEFDFCGWEHNAASAVCWSSRR